VTPGVAHDLILLCNLYQDFIDHTKWLSLQKERSKRGRDLAETLKELHKIDNYILQFFQGNSLDPPLIPGSRFFKTKTARMQRERNYLRQKRSETKLKMIKGRTNVYNPDDWNPPYREARDDSSFIRIPMDVTYPPPAPFLTGGESGYLQVPILTFSDLLLGRTKETLPPVSTRVGLMKQYPNQVQILSSGFNFDNLFQLAENVVTDRKDPILVPHILDDARARFGSRDGDPTVSIIGPRQDRLVKRIRTQLTRIKYRFRRLQFANGIFGPPDNYRAFIKATTKHHSSYNVEAGEDLSLPCITQPYY
jgi:hypothetical protein